MRDTYADAAHGVTIDLMPGDVVWLLCRVMTAAHLGFRGQGYARQLMDQVLADADAEHIALILSVEPGAGTDETRLRAWYARLGFTQLMPDDRDTLIRHPAPDQSLVSK